MVVVEGVVTVVVCGQGCDVVVTVVGCGQGDDCGDGWHHRCHALSWSEQ